MPLIRSRDITGPYYKWGKFGHKYYYQSNNHLSREMARARAVQQAKAIEASKHHDSKQSKTL